MHSLVKYGQRTVRAREEGAEVEEVAAEILASLSLSSPSIILVRMLNLLFDVTIRE